MNTSARLPATLFALLLCALLMPNSAGAIEYFATAPGHEKLVAEILGQGAELPGGCVFESARIGRRRIEASYRCSGADAPAGLALVHPSSAGEAAAASAKFKILEKGSVPSGLAAEIAKRAAAREQGWQWIRVWHSDPKKSDTNPTAPRADAAAIAGAGEDLHKQYQKVVDLYFLGKHAEALEGALAVARKNPRVGGILGYVVSNLAPTSPDDERTRAYAEVADKAPDDPLAQFVAGVAAHYNAHNVASSVERKKELYEQAIHYLTRARPAFDFAPRVFIYLAVSNYRLGRQEQAEEMIDKAIGLSEKDPDAFYCRAEIHHRKDVAAALRDLDRYLKMVAKDTGERKRRGPSGKLDRVKAMKAYLEMVQKGERELVELFDPINETASAVALAEVSEPALPAGGLLGEDMTAPKGYARLFLIVLALMALGGAAFWALRTLARRRKS